MIVVTGYRGFIGRHVVNYLASRGEDLMLVDRVLDWAPGGFPTVKPDDLVSIERPTEVSGVVHLGATTDTTLTDMAGMMENNATYSKKLWDWCSKNAIPMVYASSAAVYGHGENGFGEDVPPHLLQPLNVYGLSKLHMDHSAIYSNDNHPPRWYGLRFFNVYGRGEEAKGRMASMVSQACRQAVGKGEVVLFEGGQQRRDYVHVSDVVGYVKNCLYGNAASGIYNVGSGTATSFSEMADIVFSELGMEPKISYIPIHANLVGRYQEYTKADVGKAWRLGVNSAMPLRLGIREVLDGLSLGRSSEEPT